MKIVLKNISKILYGLLMLSFFLPAIKSCTGMEGRKTEGGQDSISVDTTKAAVDTTGLASIDSAATKPHSSTEIQSDSTKTKKDYLDLVLMPDGKNDSLIGYVYRYFNKSSIAIYFILSIISFTLVLKNRNPKTLFKLSILTTILLGLFLYWGDTVVWGFWVILSINISILIINLIRVRLHSKDNNISTP
ncbi:hypothetical protein NF867_02530 [Solitalea sp. MAHUQ-68]|uniref:Uncharacterized protein n=1 Tax=Solitalea agri TaxID=2953739 RepID=A0A9X2F3K4_9SPHI|nr:hypothetical protein [Solitalea agri]MCO4291736.1 hypothetical protein [Solitalea agri]